MVCAGVFVLVRSSFILEYTPSVLLIILWLAGLTTLISGLIAVVTNDIKRVIALSTMSQLAHKYYINILYIIFKHQTICVEIFIKNINSQITKAHNILIYYISNNLFNSFSAWRQYFLYKILITIKNLVIKYIKMSEKWKIIIISKLVGISEAIRLILIYNILSHLYKYFIFILNNMYILLINLFNIFIYNNHLYNAPQGGIMPFPQRWEGPNLYIINYNNEINNNNQDNKLDLYDSIKEEEDLIEIENITENQYENIGNIDNVSTDPFNEWLAGIIDGDGYFNLSKKGTARLTITMDIKDKSVLYDIKHKFGGSIYEIANANALRYKLSHRKGLINLINAVNGNIRNPKRMLQMNKLCHKYNINLIFPKPLTFNNGWLAGIIDSDGSIHMNVKSGQIFISVTQKDKYILEPLIKLYSGRIRTISPNIEAFRYDIFRKLEIFNLIDNYFNKYPLRSSKIKKLNLIRQFYLLRPFRNSTDIIELNKWLDYKNKWDKISKE